MLTTDKYPYAYIQFLIEFHGKRDYFECHEIMEEFWKEQLHDPQRNVWLGLIQIAVGLYHHRTGNRNGAIKMLRGAHKQLTANDPCFLAIDSKLLLQTIDLRLRQLQTDMTSTISAYTDFDIPLLDTELIRFCQDICREQHLQWCAPSDLKNDSLIFKHTLRDRSDVITARLNAITEKRRNENESR